MGVDVAPLGVVAFENNRFSLANLAKRFQRFDAVIHSTLVGYLTHPTHRSHDTAQNPLPYPTLPCHRSFEHHHLLNMVLVRSLSINNSINDQGVMGPCPQRKR